ncbi:MAG: patatin-like phospholipase family protein [Nitrososphaeraceae archaeon]
MPPERAHRSKQEERETTIVTPKKQRALIFQGGGALGAYEAGVYRVLYDWISKNVGNKNENLFDVIAGTSIGALNGAVIVSHIIEKKKDGVDKPLAASEYWKGSAEKLEDFWRHIQTRYFFTDWLDMGFWPWDYFHHTIKAIKGGWSNVLDKAEESIPYIQYNPFAKEWIDLLHFTTEAWDIPALAEPARRYWITRTFGSPNVAAAIPRWDLKFWDSSLGFRFRGEQKRLPFWWFSPTYSLEESCRNYIKFPIRKTEYEKLEPRFLLVSVDVQSGDTVSFDSYFDTTEYDEYDEWKETNKSEKGRQHTIRYPEGIEWDHLSTTFSMPDLYRFSTLQDEQTGKKRTFWDGGVLSNTPLRELIGQHKKYWTEHIEKRGDKIWDGENGAKIPDLDVCIVDVWPAKLWDEPVPSDNDFVASRKTDLILLDKTEYEESVTKMITHYMKLVERLLGGVNDKDKPTTKELLEKEIIDNTLNRKGIKTYRDLLKGNFDINRIMRIERKDDLYAVGYAMEDFSARTVHQLLERGKYDALEELIRSLSHIVDNLDKRTLAEEEDEDGDKKVSAITSETKNSLREHLEKASELLRNKENYPYQEVIDHLYDFADEVNTRESNHQLSHNKANLLRP